MILFKLKQVVGMKKIIILILLLFFIVGCIPKQEDNDTDNDTDIGDNNMSEEINQTVEHNETGNNSDDNNSEDQDSGNQTDNLITGSAILDTEGQDDFIEALKEFLRKLAKKDYEFKEDFKDCDDVKYHTSNIMQDFVIEELDDTLDSYDQFYDYTNKFGYEFCQVPDELFGNLTGTVDPSEFESDVEYRDYVTKKLEMVMKYIITEQVFEEGKVLETFLTLDAYDYFGYFQGGSANYMVKIYCAPDVIVKIKPRDIYLRGFSSQTQDTVDKNNKYLLDDMRSDIFPDIVKLLEFCPVTSEFFDGFTAEDIITNRTYFYYADLPSGVGSSPDEGDSRIFSVFSTKNVDKSSSVQSGSKPTDDTDDGGEDEGRGGQKWDGGDERAITWS